MRANQRRGVWEGANQRRQEKHKGRDAERQDRDERDGVQRVGVARETAKPDWP